MKRGILVLCWIILIAVNSCVTGDQGESGTFVPDADNIQIVLFHLAQRCESCNAVEQETRDLLELEFREEVLAEKIRFISLDFQTENGKRAASFLGASGQSLYVVRGARMENLTSAAFMYASTHPEYYHEALRKALDNFLE
jgi:hypothetical protein